MLLRAVGLSLRPARVILGTLGLLVALLASRLALLWSNAPDPLADLATRASRLAGGSLGDLIALDLRGSLDHLWELALIPARLVLTRPLDSLTILPLAFALFVIPAAAICRMAACEFSLGTFLPWREAVAFAARRWPSLLGIALIPCVGLSIALGCLAAFGGALLSLPYADVLGGILYIIAILIGLVGAAIIVLTVLASPMLIPAIVCEGTDALDALQRGYAYVVLRPLRLFGSMLVLAAIGALLAVTLSFLADRVVWLADRGATLIPIDHPREVIAEARGGAETRDATGQAEPATPGPAARAIAFWSDAIALALGGWMVSYICCAGTLLYLTMRRVCDGQDVEELWSPGMIEATMARAVRARAEVGAQPPTTLPPSAFDD